MVKIKKVKMHPITEAPQEAAPAGGAYISERLRNPDTVKAKAPAGNYMAAGICSIIAFISFIIMLVFLWQDYQALSFA